MSTMNRNTRKQKYFSQIDVATSPVRIKIRRPRSRTSTSSVGSFIPEIRDMESQFQFELGKSFFDREVVRAEHKYRITAVYRPDTDVQLSKISTDFNLEPSQSLGYNSDPLDTEMRKSLNDGLLRQWGGDNGSTFAEYIINGCLNPRAVAKRKKLEEKKRSEADQLNDAENRADINIFDDLGSTSISELHIEQIDINNDENIEFAVGEPRELSGNYINVGNEDTTLCPVEGVSISHDRGDNIEVDCEGQKTQHGDIDELNLTEEIKEGTNKDSLENHQSDVTDEIKTSCVENVSTEASLIATQQNEEVKLQPDAVETSEISKLIDNTSESPKPPTDDVDTASVGKRSVKSERSSSARSNKKVTFEESKKGKPKSAKSAKGKRGKSGKNEKGDKKGKKKKSPTPPPEVIADIVAEPEPVPQPIEAPVVEEIVVPEPQDLGPVILDDPPKYCLTAEYKSKDQMVRDWLHGGGTGAAITTLPIL